MSTTTEKPTVLRPPTKSAPPPNTDEAPQGAPAPRQSTKPKPVCPDCSIETMPSGEGVATVIIPPDIMRRLKNRAQGLTVDEFTWSYVFKPALNSAVY